MIARMLMVRPQLTVGMLLILLSGCSLLNPPRQIPTTAKPAPVIVPEQPRAAPPPATTPPPPPPHAVPTAPPAPPAATRQYHLSPATQSLVNQAHSQMARGDLTGAATTLDRALRIEPQNPLLWIELAHLRLSEKDGRQAESCARKALSLGSSDPVTRLTAGHALIDALRTQHKEVEAQTVESQSWMN